MIDKKHVVLAVWTVIVIVGLVIIGNWLIKDEIYTGTDITFKSSYKIQIEGQKVTFEAASNEFFALYNPKGGSITGEITDKPLGWSGKNYFYYKPQEISAGTWIFTNGFRGSIDAKITSYEPVTVRVISEDKFLGWLLGVIFALIIWMVGYLILDF